MDSTIISLLNRYTLQTQQDYENALKEILQQMALLGLWRAKFFEHAAFYGGTSMRILYGLNRFSEDLDFSLLKKNKSFNLASYLKAIEDELASFGFQTSITIKEKNIDTNIQSAFLNANTQQHLISIQAPESISKRYHHQNTTKIKLEIDTDPPLGFNTETKALFQPIPFWVKSYTLPDLFAGKISACLCRQWGSRIKGRDWYDFLWFIQQNAKLHVKHLEKRLRQSGFYHDKKALTLAETKKLLHEKIDQLDIALAKKDISVFIKNNHDIVAWNKALFHAAVDSICE